MIMMIVKTYKLCNDYILRVCACMRVSIIIFILLTLQKENDISKYLYTTKFLVSVRVRCTYVGSLLRICLT